MRIIFDLRKVGLGNNGGSSTLVKSGNTLVKLGHDIYFIDSMKNMHKWEKLIAKHIIVKNESDIPDADAIIATGYKSVRPTVAAPKRCGLKAHWIRAWEYWQFPDQEIISKVLQQPTIKLVNSICLQEKLKRNGFDSYIVRPGYDFELYYPLDYRKRKKSVVIGGLYREGIHGKRKRTHWLIQTAQVLKRKHKDIKFWMFGSEKQPKESVLDKYLRSPSVEEKNEFYNNIDIWMAPTMSEGLHLPPAEAMLTQCPVVATTAELSGTQDYLIDNKTGLVSREDPKDFIYKVETLYFDPRRRKHMGEEARFKIFDLGSREQNMENLIKLLKQIKQ